MSTINITNARQNLFQLVADVNVGYNPITIVNNKGKNAVLISEEEWKNIQETLYLSSVPGLVEDLNNIRKNEVATAEILEHQQNTMFKDAPVISIIMPAYNTPPQSLRQTLLSVKKQSYSKWELCISDGGNISVKPVIDEIFGDDERIKYKKLKDNLGISGNSNEALAIATGDFVAFLDHDDILEPDVLYEVASVIMNTGADMVYTDEDKVSENLENYFRLYRKPDYKKELLLSNNYICHFCAISRSRIDITGGFRSEYDGAQDYDLFLRCTEYATGIQHINKVLYHWRVSTESTSDNPFNKE